MSPSVLLKLEPRPDKSQPCPDNPGTDRFSEVCLTKPCVFAIDEMLKSYRKHTTWASRARHVRTRDSGHNSLFSLKYTATDLILIALGLTESLSNQKGEFLEGWINKLGCGDAVLNV